MDAHYRSIVFFGAYRVFNSLRLFHFLVLLLMKHLLRTRWIVQRVMKRVTLQRFVLDDVRRHDWKRQTNKQKTKN